MPHPDASRPTRPDLLHLAELAACGNTDADRLAEIASALLDGATFAEALCEGHPRPPRRSAYELALEQLRRLTHWLRHRARETTD